MSDLQQRLHQIEFDIKQLELYTYDNLFINYLALIVSCCTSALFLSNLLDDVDLSSDIFMYMLSAAWLVHTYFFYFISNTLAQFLHLKFRVTNNEKTN